MQLTTICLLLWHSDPNSGNGADLGHYSWTQTLTDTALIFPVPAGTKAKSVVCEIQPRYLKIGLKGEIPLLEVKFPWNLSGVEFVHGCAIPDRLLVYNSENPSTISRIRIPLAKHHWDVLHSFKWFMKLRDSIWTSSISSRGLCDIATQITPPILLRLSTCYYVHLQSVISQQLTKKPATESNMMSQQNSRQDRKA